MDKELLNSKSFYLLDLFYIYDDNVLKIILVGRVNKTNRAYIIITDFRPFFYVEMTTDNPNRMIEKLNSLKALTNWTLNNISINDLISKKKYFRGIETKVIKLIGKHPYLIPELKKELHFKKFTCLEADIPYIQRYLIDNAIYCGTTLIIPDEFIVKSNIAAITYQTTTEFVSNHLSPETEAHLLIASIDIETGNTDKITFQNLIEKKNERIIAISISYSWYNDDINQNIDTKSFIIEGNTDKYEKILLESFINFLKILDPDILVTFNGDKFDLPYLEARLNKYDLNLTFGEYNQKLTKSPIDNKYRVNGLTLIDLFPKAWNINTKSGKKRLIDIAEHFFQDEPNKILKLDLSELPGSLLLNKKNELLKEYVEQDSKITLELFYKMGTGDLAIVKVNGAPYSEALLATGRVNGEFELMRILVEKNIIIPSKPDKEKIKENKRKRKEHPHTGGQVITPKKTISENIIIADFISMYPTLMSAYNVGSESYISDTKFKNEPRTTLSLLQERVIEKRIEIKQKIKLEQDLSDFYVYNLQHHQKALKMVANSMYGATLYVSGRFFDIEVCNSITHMARNLMNDIFLIANQFGYEHNIETEIIYSDTDSIFIRLKPLISVKNIKEWLLTNQEMLLKYINLKVPKGMELSLEDIAKRIIFQKMSDTKGELRKKAYAYFSILNDKLIIKGFEAIRSDLAPITKKTQENLFYILLNDHNPEIKADKYLRSVIKIIKNIDENQLLTEATFSGIIKPPKNYKSKTPAIGAFINYCGYINEEPDIYYVNFSRFPYAITLEGNKNEPLYKKARHPEIIQKYKLKIDRDFYINEIIRIAERFELKNPTAPISIHHFIE